MSSIVLNDKEYVIQKDILNRLRVNGLATFTKTSFIEAVNRGVIPFHQFEGFKKKYYNFEDVAEAIKVAGIGKPKTTQQKLEDLPDIKVGQDKDEYQQEIAELTQDATITDANIYKTIYQGKLEKLKYDKEQGLLVSRDEVEDKAFAVSRAIRDKILSIPERMSNELASMSEPHEIKELLYKEFGLMLDGFSNESFN